MNLSTWQRRGLIGIVGAVAVYYSFLLFFSGDFLPSPSQQRESQARLVRIQNSIRPGDSFEAVLRAYWASEPGDVRILPISETSWVMQSPMTPFLVVHSIQVAFNDGCVVSVTMRASSS